MDKHIDKSRFTFKELPWEASYGFVPTTYGSSFSKSTKRGEDMLIEMIDKDPNPVVLRGYSGGAVVAGNVAARIGRGELPHLDIRGVALVADPLNPQLPGSNRWGIAGSRDVRGNFPVWRANDPKDVICLCPANSPLRTLADQSAAMSLADPVAWGQDLINRLVTNRWQKVALNFWRPNTVVQQYAEAIEGVRGYLTGDHTSYHKRGLVAGETYLDHIGKRINGISA